MVWYSHLLKNFPQFIVIHTVKGFGIVNKAEIDVFLELSCFFNEPLNIGNLISGSSAFSKTSLNIWKFTVHVLLKPGLENFKHHYTSLTCYKCYHANRDPWVLTASTYFSASSFFKFLFIIIVLCWVFVAVCRLSPAAAGGGCSLVAGDRLQ